MQRHPAALPGSLDEERPGAHPGQAAHRGGGDAEDDLPQESKAEAQAQWDTVADALREKQDELGTFTDASRDDVLA